MSKHILDNLFGSKARVKILRFLYRRYPDATDVRALARRVQESPPVVRAETELLRSVGLIKEKDHCVLDPEFELFSELRALILKASPTEKNHLVNKILKLGRVKLAVISGIFLNPNDDRGPESATADLFIVGDDIDRRKLNVFLKSLEAEVGREIKFGIMEKEEFEYRYSMFDRFVRVLLEGPHEKIINRLGI